MNILKKFSMEGCCSIVTGAATGLGKAMAVSLSQAGSNIVIADINIERAEETAEEIRADGTEVFVVKTDVSSQEDCIKLAKAVKSRFGRIDVLINNAGICIHEKAEDMQFTDWKKVIDIDISGVFLMSQAIGKVMIEQKKGSIINISSMSGLIVNTPQCQCSYNSAKAAVNMLTKSLAIEWAKHNIRVNSIAPGFIATDMTDALGDEQKDALRKQIPLQRLGTPEDIASLVGFLTSDAGSYITGETVHVNGGMYMS